MHAENPAAYSVAIDRYVQIQKSAADPLLRLDGPDYMFSTHEYDSNALR